MEASKAKMWRKSRTMELGSTYYTGGLKEIVYPRADAKGDKFFVARDVECRSPEGRVVKKYASYESHQSFLKLANPIKENNQLYEVLRHNKPLYDFLDVEWQENVSDDEAMKKLETLVDFKTVQYAQIGIELSDKVNIF
jgi:hypothetical protein